jgi:lipid II:glycine glycyltransferase (peptidoglycan interpeptide bridge formation enzyme)
LTNNQSTYHQLCKQEGENIPFYSQAWWLDAICMKSWDVVFYHDKNGIIQGAFPYAYRTKMGLKIFNTPRRSPFSGIWINPKPSEKQATRVSHYRTVCTAILDQLPKHHFAQFKLSPTIYDWYPFYLKGFGEKIKYTYQLDISIEKEKLFRNFHKRIRKEIKPFLGQINFTDSIDTDTIFSMLNKSYEEQNDNLNVRKDVLSNINSAASERNKIVQLNFSGKDEIIIGSINGIIENGICYALLTGMDKKNGGRGLFSFVIWKLIEYLKEKGIQKIDFCGSMMPEVERRFRHLNSQQIPYHTIWHGENKVLNYFFWKRYIK